MLLLLNLELTDSFHISFCNWEQPNVETSSSMFILFTWGESHMAQQEWATFLGNVILITAKH